MQPYKKARNIMISLIITVIIAGAIVNIYKYNEAQARKNYIEHLETEIARAEESISVKKAQIKKALDGNTFVILDINMANVYESGDIETGYGETIYASTTMYLKPQIEYLSLDEKYISFKVRITDPDGNIRRNYSSPGGFTYKTDDESISEGIHTLVLTGWGKDIKGHWSAGDYTIEIWNKNDLLAVKTFTIYQD